LKLKRADLCGNGIRSDVGFDAHSSWLTATQPPLPDGTGKKQRSLASVGRRPRVAPDSDGIQPLYNN